jgi:hypothetical protein
LRKRRAAKKLISDGWRGRSLTPAARLIRASRGMAIGAVLGNQAERKVLWRQHAVRLEQLGDLDPELTDQGFQIVGFGNPAGTSSLAVNAQAAGVREMDRGGRWWDRTTDPYDVNEGFSLRFHDASQHRVNISAP